MKHTQENWLISEDGQHYALQCGANENTSQTDKKILAFNRGIFVQECLFFFNIINIKTIYPVPPPRFTTNKAISRNEKPMLCPKLHTWHTSSQQIVLWGSNFYAIASSQNTHCIFFSHTGSDVGVEACGGYNVDII